MSARSGINHEPYLTIGIHVGARTTSIRGVPGAESYPDFVGLEHFSMLAALASPPPRCSAC
ncbi:hypothetical protein [Mycobacterium leprae]|uniref:hypothetical protein n=1 Tax=Mycobacterium leprae TaxID=1769 RepID=UPI00031A7CFC